MNIRRFILLVGWLLLAAVPFWAEGYTLTTLRDVLLFGLFALSLDYLWGKTGILSFGHAAFFGLGAYGMAIVTLKLGIDPQVASMLGLLVGVALPMVIAGLIGYFLIFGGVRAAYLTIVTLALTIIAQQVAIGWSDMTGGDSGLIGVPPLTLNIGDFSFVLMDPAIFYWVVFGLSSLILYVLWRVCSGHYGKVLTALEDNETRIRSLGYHTPLHLLGVFVVSAGIAGLAGALYATGTSFVTPDLIGLMLSTEVIMWVAVGGRGTLVGPFIGAFVVWWLRQEVSSIDTKLWPLFIGGFFILMVFAFPNGLLSALDPIRNRLARRAEKKVTS
ncbi:MAG TPA: branched-chain amino acid ABC transporter permease [Burkholderiaceae bacterium]|nr:branched-chain amino acid ABC transporter permease [Burkholderiaceae bacterium]